MAMFKTVVIGPTGVKTIYTTAEEDFESTSDGMAIIVLFKNDSLSHTQLHFHDGSTAHIERYTECNCGHCQDGYPDDDDGKDLN